MLIRDLYLDQLRPLIGQPTVKVLTGVRGSGKTTILHMLQDVLLGAGIPADHIIRINLELMESAEVSNDKRLISFIKYRMVNPGRHFVLLDEIQMVEQWEQAVALLANDSNCDLYLTASDAGRLAANLHETIPGRFTEIRVLPLSLAEYAEIAGSQDSGRAADLQQLADEYIRQGGLPILAAIPDQTAADQASLGLFRAILYQDVVLRNHIRDAELLNRIIRFVLTHTGKIFAVKSIGDYLISRSQRASAETIANYLRALEEAGLFFRVPRYDVKAQMILHNNTKYYLADHGLLRVITGQKDRSPVGILQNTVFLELNRRGFKVAVGKLGNTTIDFVADKDGRRLYIQVLERRGTADALQKAAEPLRKIKEKADFYIVARDSFSPVGLNGIKGVGLADFLLSDEI